MSLSQWLFATGYDLLNTCIESHLASYREQTAGRARGDVLEIGGGTGANLGFYDANVRLTMVEPNPHMAKRLTRKAARMGVAVEVVPDVGENLSFPTSSFDSVVTTLVLCTVNDLNRVVAEAARVLRPGGSYYFYEHVATVSGLRRHLENAANPFWKFATTGCNLNRDIESAIRIGGFRSVQITKFDLSIYLPITLPNVVGSAQA